MLLLIFLLILFLSFTYEAYEKLPQYDSINVIPDTKVYIDMSSFNNGSLISIEIGLDFIHSPSYTYKHTYTYKIGQVAASTFYDPIAWNNLPYVNNSNVTCDSSEYCIFRWEEIKSSGNNFIYILPPAPYNSYYSLYSKKIKISMIKEEEEEGKEKSKRPNALGIVGIVFGCIGIISLIISIILYYRICSRKNLQNSDNNFPAPMIPEVKDVETADNKPVENTDIKPPETKEYQSPTLPYNNAIN